jgi:hypothetical protein
MLFPANVSFRLDFWLLLAEGEARRQVSGIRAEDEVIILIALLIREAEVTFSHQLVEPHLEALAP